ncbi:MAG: hypothetical protein ACI4VL_02975 [Bacilli bacterium]
MKKKKNKKVIDKYKNDNKRMILVFTMMLCIIVSMCTYWIYAYQHKHNYSDGKFISYKISDYVITDGNVIYLNNIDKSINDDFVIKQKEILKNNVLNMNITKGLYNEILSIRVNYILSNGTSNYEENIALNIDIRNDKTISNDELLELIDVNYKDIANDIYDKYIKLPSDSKKEIVDAITEEKMSSSEFNNNSEKYIIRIREKLPDVMMLYIDKGNVYYLVNKYEINKVCYYTDINMGYINNKIGKI